MHTQDILSVFMLLFVFSFFAYFSRIVLLPVFALLLPKRKVVIFAPEGNCEGIEDWFKYHTISGVKIVAILERKKEIKEYVNKGFPVVLSTFTDNWQKLIDYIYYFKQKTPIILFAPLLCGIEEVDYWAYLEGIPIIYFRWSGNSKIYLFVKKMMDFVGSIIAITIFSPFMIAAAIGIKLTSKGPILFIQNRIKKGGEPFNMLKFRSMILSSDEEPHKEFVKQCINGKKELNFKLLNDSRITAWGKILRKTSIDEFPQFFNVLIGELSLVGPRPPMEYEVKQYSEWHKKRLSVKQGITGVWQVFGRARLSFAKSCFLDIYYAENRSFCLDAHLLSQTPHTVFFGKGAY